MPDNDEVMDELLYLSRNPGANIDPSALTWMTDRTNPFARPQTLVTDGAMGGFVITPAGLNWLSIAKYTEYVGSKFANR